MTKKRWKLPKSMTTITPFSKALALSMFVLFPIISFCMGRMYERATAPIGYCAPLGGIPMAQPLP